MQHRYLLPLGVLVFSLASVRSEQPPSKDDQKLKTLPTMEQIAATKSDKLYVRRTAVREIIDLGPQDGVLDTLADVLRVHWQDSDIELMTAKAIWRFGPEAKRLIPFLVEEIDAGTIHWPHALSAPDFSFIPFRTPNMATPNRHVTPHDILASIGRPAVLEVIHLLYDEYPPNRLRAAATLEAIALEQKSLYFDTRVYFWDAFPPNQKEATSRGKAALRRFFKDPSEEVMLEGCRALNYLDTRSKETVPTLTKIFNMSKSTNMRLAALDELGKLGPLAAEAIPSLKESMKNQGGRIFQRTKKILEIIQPSKN